MLAAVFSFVATQNALGADCPRDPKVDAWSAKNIPIYRAVIFGETHGTSEIPRVFLEYVCAASRVSSELLVGLEISGKSLQMAKHAIEAKERGDDQNSALRASEFWLKGHDGRSSKANFQLIEHLVELENKGKLVLVGFDARVTGRENFGATAVAEIMKNVPKKWQSWRVVLLTGRGHSDFGSGESSLAEPLASEGLRTLTVQISHGGGTAWVCQAGACGPSNHVGMGCDNPAREPGTYRNIDGLRSDADLCIGKITASEPMLLPE